MWPFKKKTGDGLKRKLALLILFPLWPVVAVCYLIWVFRWAYFYLEWDQAWYNRGIPWIAEGQSWKRDAWLRAKSFKLHRGSDKPPYLREHWGHK